MGTALQRPFLTPLRIIAHPKGVVMHALKASDAGFAGFGEAYFSTVLAGETKGWKKHLRMQMNLVVPMGSIQFHLHDERTGITEVYTLNQENYQRLTVPAGFWMAFRGMAAGASLLLNVANLQHDPAEAVNVDLATFALGATP